MRKVLGTGSLLGGRYQVDTAGPGAVTPTGRDVRHGAVRRRPFGGCRRPRSPGLTSALLGEGDPLNVIGSLPGNGGNDHYSPLWDVHATEWTAAAVAAGLDERQTDLDDIRDLAADGLVTGPCGATWGAIDVIVNCPVISIED
jgi:hypothetical protein